MIAYKCDRCGAYYDNIDFKTDIEGYSINRYNTPLDLCDNCKNDLLNFIEGVKTNAVEEV